MDIKIVSKSGFLKENESPDQEAVWDSIASAWNKYVVKKIPIVEEFLKNKKGKIIDLGCGDGRNMIAGKDIKYYGVDFSFKSLKHLQKKCKKERINSKLFKSRIDKLDKKIFKDNMFDYGLFIASLHCLESPNERLNALKEFYRVLKPGAQGLISVWNSKDKRFKCVNNKGETYMSWRENNIPLMRYYYLFEKEEFLGLLREVGFKVLEFYKPREDDRFSKKNWIVRIGK